MKNLGKSYRHQIIILSLFLVFLAGSILFANIGLTFADDGGLNVVNPISLIEQMLDNSDGLIATTSTEEIISEEENVSSTEELITEKSTSTTENSETSTEDNIFSTTIIEDLISTSTEENLSPLKSIAIRNFPNKRTFFVGEELNIVGLVVLGTFNDGTVKIVPISPAPDMANVIGFDSSNPVNNQTITIKYEGQATSYAIDILALN